MTIKEVAKKALAKFKGSGYIFSPDEYYKAFCEEAKKAKIIIEDCNKVSKFLEKLDKRYKTIALNYRIQNLDEFIIFLINQLNRENPTKEKETLESLFLYTKRALDVIAVLPILKSKQIALKHLDILKPTLSKEEFNRLRNEWIDFLSTFDDKLIKKASIISGAKSEDVFKILDKLLQKFEQSTPEVSEYFIDTLINTLTPSYAPFMNDDIVELRKQIKSNPSFIFSQSFIKEIDFLTKKRIKLDKDELKKKLKDLDQIAERVSVKILNILTTSNNSSEKIKDISIEIQNWRHSDKFNFENLKEKLLTIAKSLDKEINSFSFSIKKEEEEIEKLRKRIAYLEGKVKELSEEVKTDFLTNVATKKALIEELKKQDSAYKRYKAIYSIVFFDIDFFKKVNDTYGHDAGDIILKSLGILFNRYARDVDTIGRFGGEEFVAILPHTQKEGAYKFAEKIRKIVEKTKFMYKKTRINITISSGVASRDEVNDYEELLKLADERLYLAKKNGRNRVCADDKCS